MRLHNRVSHQVIHGPAIQGLAIQGLAVHRRPTDAPLPRRPSPRPNPRGQDLACALAGGEIFTAYQPKVALQTGELVGMEALARWTSPSFGAVAPDRFIPLAEQTGQIAALTDFILTNALATCARLRRRIATLTVAVNISPLLLDDPLLPDRIEAALEHAGLPPAALVAEITESRVIPDTARASATLQRLRVRGIACAIDDFGTGHASLLTLLRLPFSELKIDQAFVGSCAIDREAEQIVRATIGLAREMQLNVVAEGIETEATATLLRRLGCTVGQGFRYGHPENEAAFSGRFDDPVRMLSSA